MPTTVNDNAAAIAETLAGMQSLQETHQPPDNDVEMENNDVQQQQQQQQQQNNDNNNMEVDPPPQEPGHRLQEMRDNFNPENIRRSSKNKSTFDKHQRQNQAFILFLLDHEEYHHLLDEEFTHELVDINTEVDYTDVESKFPAYVRRGGKKTLAERKEEYRISLLKEHISYALNDPGMVPRQPTVNLAALCDNVDVFMHYITTQRKEGEDNLMKAKTYSGYRSSLTYLFTRYRALPTREFERDLGTCMEGVKRYSTEANQHGEGNAWDGDRPLSWPLMGFFNLCFMAMGNEEGIFAAAFSKLTLNLCCRGKSTGQIVLKQFTWEGDSLAIPFIHGKEHQTGDNVLKKLPRHCYTNPLDQKYDLSSSLFHYLALNPDVIARGEQTPLFDGSLKAQSEGKV